MKEKILFTEKPLNKEVILKELEDLGEKYNYIIVKKDTYKNADIDFYTDYSYDYLISFSFTKQKTNEKYSYKKEDRNIQTYMAIQYEVELDEKLNILLKEILQKYPEMYVSNDSQQEFYNIENFNSKVEVASV
ncbi:hypothetical protein [Aureivirga marina]|uniref:hypothetical protein n=1 Tax=Aureivirga marina TaxID=1182451 RepID=UPI0018CBAF2C|nr:hypothetical protein [Aureivirga marina]